MNNHSVTETNSPKQLGIGLNNRLSFEEYLKMTSNKVNKKIELLRNKTIGRLRKLHNILPKSALLTIYKDFVRPHLYYGNIIYD